MRRFSTLCLFIVFGIQSVSAAEGLSWNALPAVPDSLGVAGPFAGVHVG
jgi:hypothetical protein